MKTKIPKGYHIMPDGSIMKDSDHKMAKGGSTAAWTRSEGKSKTGGFPDLNKDGKVTKADILKGRGVIKKVVKTKKK